MAAAPGFNPNYRMVMPNGQVVPTPGMPTPPPPLPATAAHGYVMTPQQQQQQPAGSGSQPATGKDSPADRTRSDLTKTKEGQPWNVFGR